MRGGEVDLALLWSCHGAGGFGALEAGVAEALLDPQIGNVAAVLASFTAVEAPAVAELSAELIDAWAASPDGDLEVALARARSRMDERSLTWARPILFLRTVAATLGAPPPTVPAMPGSAGHGLRWLPQLPARSEHYVDHQQRRAALEQDLAHHAVVVLEGLPGVGKTELALAAAHRLRAAGQDVAFVDVTGHGDASLLQLILGQLVRKEPFERREELLAALRGRRWTLVLDNAEDLLHSAASREDLLALIAGLCATGPGFRAVVTTRHALAAPGSAAAAGLFVREQPPLTLDEARALFVAVAGPRLAPAQATPAVLDPLLRELGGIARAVVLMAGQLGGAVDVVELRRRLADEGARAIVEAELFGVPVPEALDSTVNKRRLVSALNLSLKSAAARAPECLDLFDALGAFPAGLAQTLLPREDFPWLTDALGVLLEHHLLHLAGESKRVMIAAPVQALAAAWGRHRHGRLAAGSAASASGAASRCPGATPRQRTQRRCPAGALCRRAQCAAGIADAAAERHTTGTGCPGVVGQPVCRSHRGCAVRRPCHAGANGADGHRGAIRAARAGFSAYRCNPIPFGPAASAHG